MIKVSVLMSIYNESINQLTLAIDSILKQSYKDFEYIIVCDNPDNKEIIDYVTSIDDKRIIFLINEQNIGLARSLNKAFLASSGELIARMDADDISELTRLEKQIEYMSKNPTCDILATNAILINEDNEKIGCTHVHINNYNDMQKLLLIKNVIIHPSIMMKRSCFLDLKGYRPYPAVQDYDMWLRALYDNKTIGMMDDYLINFRIRDNSISAKKHYIQLLLENYSKAMFFDRGLSFADYTESKMNEYLIKHKANNEKYIEKKNKKFNYYKKAKKALKEKKVLAFLIYFLISIFDRDNRLEIKKSIKFRKMQQKILKNR